jgi:FMN reductase
MSLLPNSTTGEVVVLVGHPYAGSRTGAVGRAVAAQLGDEPGPTLRVVELNELGTGPLAAGSDAVQEAENAVRQAGLLVVATPVLKAGYPGILKLFLDRLEPTALESVVAVPVVLTASSAHGALADLQLRIVLQAVGALLPVPSFVLEEHHLDDLPQYVDAWQGRFGPAVRAVVRALNAEQVPAR